jgi:alkylation response protein AidB-like acyl-CoA dehydrogenase
MTTTRTAVDDSDQRALRTTARDFFEKYSDESAVRSAMETDDGFDRALWSRMADELGLQGLLVPDRFGGNELGFVELQIVMEEMGRALVCAPFLSSAVLCVTALLASDDDDRCSELLPAIASGSRIAALVFASSDGRWNPLDTAVRGDKTAAGWTVTGERHAVLDGATADLLLIAATTDDGPSLFAVDTRAEGCQSTPLETLDMTRQQTDMTFQSVSATLVGSAGAADAYLRAALNAGLAALAAEQVGGARRLLEMSVEYAKVREQFGRPIGSFQAIKHKCADMLVEVESSTSAAYAAGAALDENSSESALLASLAKAYCSEAYCHVAAENIQIHGGIGFTWEHDAHLYLKRAKSAELLFGAPVRHRARLAALVGI